MQTTYYLNTWGGGAGRGLREHEIEEQNGVGFRQEFSYEWTQASPDYHCAGQTGSTTAIIYTFILQYGMFSHSASIVQP